MRIGVTGNRTGMSIEQRVFMLGTLADDYIGNDYAYDNTWLLHGDCFGVDAECHDLAASNGIKIAVFPPDNPVHRAYKKGLIMHKPEPYLVRNKAIVNASDEMFGFPSTYEEVLRSGTWSTIRYAKKIKKPLTIVFPDGSTQEFNKESL